MTDKAWHQRLFHWPILVAAVVFLAGAAWMANEPVGEEAIASSLVAIAAVMLGAWIALLARAGYDGSED